MKHLINYSPKLCWWSRFRENIITKFVIVFFESLQTEADVACIERAMKTWVKAVHNIIWKYIVQQIMKIETQNV